MSLARSAIATNPVSVITVAFRYKCPCVGKVSITNFLGNKLALTKSVIAVDIAVFAAVSLLLSLS